MQPQHPSRLLLMCMLYNPVLYVNAPCFVASSSRKGPAVAILAGDYNTSPNR